MFVPFGFFPHYLLSVFFVVVYYYYYFFFFFFFGGGGCGREEGLGGTHKTLSKLNKFLTT